MPPSDRKGEIVIGIVFYGLLLICSIMALTYGNRDMNKGHNMLFTEMSSTENDNQYFTRLTRSYYWILVGVWLFTIGMSILVSSITGLCSVCFKDREQI